ncbi:MAG: hypothetical protein IKL82_05775 [Clostridia bacterium]|nr:hypothetical protein [Clostridia bacterium]
MRKRLTILFLIISSVFTLAFFATPKHVAKASEIVETEAFMPSSALELYSLTSPISVSYNDGYLVIAEYFVNPEDQTEFNRISVYNPNLKKFTALPNHPSISNVTHAEYHNGYVYYLSGSYLYYVPVSDLTKTPVKTSVTSSNFFSFNENFLITNSSNSIVIYTVSYDSEPTFTAGDPLTFTTKLALLSSEKDVYYTQAGKLYCYQARLNMTSYLVGELGVEVNYMVECGTYIYYTSASGVYRIEKGKNNQPELVVTSSQNASGLGELKSPQGITVRNGNLIIADPELKCIQEINGLNGEFTSFAITTESTADYRLTSSSSKLLSSENYVYVLDDGKMLDDGTTYKRIVKIALEGTENKYSSIPLNSLYEENPDFKVELIAISDTHALIYDGKNLNLYELDGLKKVYSIQNETVTTLNYLDGDFYYTDKALNESLSAEIVNVNKITLPSPDNELTSITEHKLTESSEISGSLEKATIDVFGNVYLLLADSQGAKSLIRYYNGNSSIPVSVEHEVISLKTDFSGSVYALSSNNVIYKYTYKESARTFEVSSYTLSAGEMTAKDIELNYRSNKCYVLLDACVLVTVGDTLEISNLSGVSADNLKLNEVTENPVFLTVNKDAKLFKVTLGNYVESEGKKYFKNITPISNPNTSRVYLVIAEIGEDYYLVSFSQKLVALVRKNTVNVDPTFKSDASVISPDNYQEFKITISELSGENYYVSNSTNVYAKPVFDVNYKTITAQKSANYKAVKTVTYNGFSMTLIKDENETLIGYVPTGYLVNTTISSPTISEETVKVLQGDNGKHFNESLMILIIALTVTLSLLFIEKKLLFDSEDVAKK